MQGFLLKRLAYAIGVLIAVSLLTFFMGTLAPGDRVEAHMALDQSGATYQQQSYTQRARAYALAARRIHADLPLFYFSIAPRTIPAQIHLILREDERATTRQLCLRTGAPDAVLAYRTAILELIGEAETSDASWAGSIRTSAEFLLITSDTARIRYYVNTMETAARDSGIPGITLVHSLAEELISQHASMTSLLPAFRWHGIANQYHRWISGVISGDFGRSLIDGRAVQTKIREALRWTLQINLIAILLAFGIAIVLGVYSARRAGQFPDRLISGVLFACYAMPGFWIAMLCIVFLTTSEYGAWLDWFPTGGVGLVAPGMSWHERIGIRTYHLVLPVFCVMIGSLAYLTRQMRGSMLREMQKDYVRLARAKGIGEDRVIWGHVFRNALFPMITLVGSAFPAAVSGSVILEVIFSIPGMGRLLYMSITAKDWPVVYAMVLLASLLTVIGYLISDLLYSKADPRIEFGGRPK